VPFHVFASFTVLHRACDAKSLHLTPRVDSNEQPLAASNSFRDLPTLLQFQLEPDKLPTIHRSRRVSFKLQLPCPSHVPFQPQAYSHSVQCDAPVPALIYSPPTLTELKPLVASYSASPRHQGLLAGWWQTRMTLTYTAKSDIQQGAGLDAETLGEGGSVQQLD
jgi:hypothetical protein